MGPCLQPFHFSFFPSLNLILNTFPKTEKLSSDWLDKSICFQFALPPTAIQFQVLAQNKIHGLCVCVCVCVSDTEEI